MRKTTTAIATAALLGTAYLAYGQQNQQPMRDMPVMQMKQQSGQTRQQPPQNQQALRPDQQQSMPDMRGMQIDGQQNQQQQPPAGMQIPKDMRNPNPGNLPADKETQSIRESEQEQRGQQGERPGPGSDAQSVTHPSLMLQEPENPNYRTGSHLPAPDLLKEVVSRPPLGLNDFLSTGEKSNPTLAEAQSLVRRSEGQAKQIGLYPNPVVGYRGDQIRGGSYGNGENGAFVQQTIVLGGKLGLRRNIYKQQANSDQIGVEEQTLRVRDDVGQAFYAALTSQAMVIVRQRLLKVTLDAQETAHQLGNVGQADAPDILQAEVEAEQAKVDFQSAQREYIQSFHTLAAVAGKLDLPVCPLTGAIENPPNINAEQQVANIISSSPSVKRAQQGVAVAEARLRDARREVVPDLMLRAGEQYSGEYVTEQPVKKAAGPESFADASINIPLWNRNQGNIQSAKAELERAQRDVERTQLQLKREAEPLAQTYLSSQFEAERYRTQLIPRAKRAYELYLMKYQQMAMAYPQVLVSQRTLFQLQISYLAALRNVWIYSVALQNYTLNGSLQAPMSAGTSSTTINLPTTGGGGSNE